MEVRAAQFWAGCVCWQGDSWPGDSSHSAVLTCVDPSIRVNITIHNTRCTSHTHRQQEEYISYSSRQNNPTLPIFRRTGTLITLCSIGFGRHFIRIVAGHHFYFLRLLNQSTRINVTKVEPCISPQVRCPLPPAPGCVTLNTSFNTVSPPSYLWQDRRCSVQGITCSPSLCARPCLCRRENPGMGEAVKHLTEMYQWPYLAYLGPQDRSQWLPFAYL